MIFLRSYGIFIDLSKNLGSKISRNLISVKGLITKYFKKVKNSKNLPTQSSDQKPVFKTYFKTHAKIRRKLILS